MEALNMIEDAKRGWLEVALSNAEIIPEPEPTEVVG
jgi:predicted RNase H-like HicB family nuclease